MRGSDTEVLRPASAAEAIEAFGDGSGVTVFAGGTILMPEIAYGRHPRAARTVMLERAGLDEITGDGTMTVGAMARLSALAASELEPLAGAARGVGDPEIRAQGTIGGNLCAPPAMEFSRGDLQAPLLALAARVRSAGADGERVEPVEDFLAARDREARLALAIEVDRPRGAAFVSQRRAHAHSYTVMSVACAQTADSVRVAAGGLGARAVRLETVERALADGAIPGEAAANALHGVNPRDDALSSAWYKRTLLPKLVRRALEQLQGG